ncbi:MAG: hypothetical protein JWN44_3749 [Myxococcales bacterium]|nr:hypothetical protein [Myxococcales bacterium]
MRGAATIEWAVLAMVVGVGSIAGWRSFEAHVAATVERGGDCIAALDGSCAGSASAQARSAAAGPADSSGPRATPTSAPDVVPVSGGIPLGPIGSSSLQWGAPGFTQGWTAEQRRDYLGQHGVADPNANYWTPFWSNGPRLNSYTGVPDTGARNQFAAIHDYNLAAQQWPWFLSYFDVVTPLSGYTHGDIDAAVLEARRRAWRKLFGS